MRGSKRAKAGADEPQSREIQANEIAPEAPASVTGEAQAASAGDAGASGSDAGKWSSALAYTDRRGRKLAPASVMGPSPNPATNLAIADIALRTGSLLARQAVERALLGRAYAPRKARRILRGRSMAQVMLHRSIAKVAMGSVPGALIVGGSLLARTLYERRKALRAEAQGRARLEDMARQGEED